jgi:hypothetical protein
VQLTLSITVPGLVDENGIGWTRKPDKDPRIPKTKISGWLELPQPSHCEEWVEKTFIHILKIKQIEEYMLLLAKKKEPKNA